MIDYLNAHQSGFWFSVGFGLLIIDALVFGFTSGVAMFAGLGALITGGLMWGGILPASWTAGIASFGVASSVSAAVLWKLLLRFQNFNVADKDNSSDFVGHRFRLTDAITLSAPGTTHYSGIQWRVEIADDAGIESIDAGTKVEVASVDAGVFRVRPEEPRD